MSRPIKDATVKRFHDNTHDQLQSHRADFLEADNFGQRLKTLRGRTPYEFIIKCGISEPERFTFDPNHQMLGLNTYQSEVGRETTAQNRQRRGGNLMSEANQSKVQRALMGQISVDDLSVEEQIEYRKAVRVRLMNPDAALLEQLSDKLANGTQFEIAPDGSSIERDPDGAVRLISFLDGERVAKSLTKDEVAALFGH